jgi:hypothetical protein
MAAKTLYQIETRDGEGLLGVYAALLTEIQAAKLKAIMDDAGAIGIFFSYRLVPFSSARGRVQAHIQALGFEGARQSVLYDIQSARRTSGKGPELGVVRLSRKDLEETARAYLEEAEMLEEARRGGMPVSPSEIYELQFRALVNRDLAAKHRREPDLELGRALEVRSLVDVLSEIESRRPEAELREYGERGRRGLWSVGELLEAVRRDHAAMTPAERASYEFHRWSWGYDAQGKIQVFHLPIRGGIEPRFVEE